jgi:hypothetical protein
MFRRVSPSIIRSSGLYIQQQTYVKQIVLPTASGNEMELETSTCFGQSLHLSPGVQDCTYNNRHMSNRYCYQQLAGTRWNSRFLHVSDGLPIYHQEFRTAHTTTDICQTDTATNCWRERDGTRDFCMFRTVSPSIIRSSGLHIQQQTYVKQILLPTASGNEMELESSTCFGRSLHPSSGVQDCTYSNRHMSNRFRSR